MLMWMDGMVFAIGYRSAGGTSRRLQLVSDFAAD